MCICLWRRREEDWSEFNDRGVCEFVDVMLVEFVWEPYTTVRRGGLDRLCLTSPLLCSGYTCLISFAWSSATTITAAAVVWNGVILAASSSQTFTVTGTLDPNAAGAPVAFTVSTSVSGTDVALLTNKKGR